MVKFKGLKGVLKVLQVFAKQHSPELLVGLGIAGSATCTVLAVKATPKVMKKIDAVIESKNEELMDIAVANHMKEYTPITKLKKTEIIQLCWRDYAPAAITGVASAICIVGGTNISLRRNAALITAVKLSEVTIKDLQTYKDKVIDVIGDDKNDEIEAALDKVQLDRATTNNDSTPINMDNISISGSGPVLYWDKMGGQWFRSDRETIREAVNRLNHLMNNDMYVSLNDFYDELGMTHTVAGDALGWNSDQGLIEPKFSSQLTPSGVPVVVISTRLEPRVNYGSLH